MKTFAFLAFLLSSSFVLSAQVIEHQTIQEDIEFEMKPVKFNIYNPETETHTPKIYVVTQVVSNGRPIIDRSPILDLHLPEGVMVLNIGSFTEIYGEEFNLIEIYVYTDQGDYMAEFYLDTTIAEFVWVRTYQ